METIHNYVGGELRPPASERYLDVVEPATGEVYARVPSSGPEDLESAVEAATRASRPWSRTPADERAKHLLALAQAVESRGEALARAESIDSGKPLALARRLDIPRAAANLRFFAAAATQFKWAIRLDPGSWLAERDYARLLVDSGKWDLAVEHYGRAIDVLEAERDPSTAEELAAERDEIESRRTSLPDEGGG